jgi:hypothetical protein
MTRTQEKETFLLPVEKLKRSPISPGEDGLVWMPPLLRFP